MGLLGLCCMANGHMVYGIECMQYIAPKATLHGAEVIVLFIFQTLWYWYTASSLVTFQSHLSKWL